MFLSHTHAPQVLDQDWYFAQKIYDLELDRLFLPGWHLVGTLADVPRPGDYLTTELLGRPLIVRNTGPQVRAYLNVCAHRFCLLTHEPRGSCATLRCQYHGWEYDDHGATRKIPDATSFRPLERGQVGLVEFRADTCGQLIFVSLAKDGLDLRSSLGCSYDVCAELFSAHSQQIACEEFHCPVNWKIPVENNLESYHLATVHAASLGGFPAESDCHHELQPGYTAFRTRGGVTGPMRWVEDLVLKNLGRNLTGAYEHTHVYPHLAFARLDIVGSVQAFLPVSPTSCRILWRAFSFAGPKKSRFWQTCANLLARWQTPAWRRIVAEDLAVYPAIQRGLESPVHPAGGLLAVREERLHHFQRFVFDACA